MHDEYIRMRFIRQTLFRVWLIGDKSVIKAINLFVFLNFLISFYLFRGNETLLKLVYIVDWDFITEITNKIMTTVWCVSTFNVIKKILIKNYLIESNFLTHLTTWIILFWNKQFTDHSFYWLDTVLNKPIWVKAFLWVI